MDAASKPPPPQRETNRWQVFINKIFVGYGAVLIGGGACLKGIKYERCKQ